MWVPVEEWNPKTPVADSSALLYPINSCTSNQDRTSWSISWSEGTEEQDWMSQVVACFLNVLFQQWLDKWCFIYGNWKQITHELQMYLARVPDESASSCLICACMIPSFSESFPTYVVRVWLITIVYRILGKFYTTTMQRRSFQLRPEAFWEILINNQDGCHCCVVAFRHSDWL